MVVLFVSLFVHRMMLACNLDTVNITKYLDLKLDSKMSSLEDSVTI